MALKTCRACGKEVSETAPSCPFCGVPDPGSRYLDRPALWMVRKHWKVSIGSVLAALAVIAFSIWIGATYFANSTTAGEIAAFDLGHSDRLTWENWINALSGVEYDGAIYWTGQRSKTPPGTCEAGAAKAYPDDPANSHLYLLGCIEAKGMLDPFDVKRKSDPIYHLGWNSPVPASGGAQSVVSPAASP